LQRSVTAISARLPLLLSAAVSRGMVFGKGALVPYMMSMQPTDAGDVIMEVHIHTCPNTTSYELLVGAISA